MRRRQNSWTGTRVGVLLGSGLLVVALAFARDFLVPIAIAGLLGFFLVPLAVRLERLKIPRVVAAILCVLLLSAGLAGVTWAVADQALSLTRSLPTYRENVVRKLRALAPDGAIGESLAEAKEGIERLKHDLEKPNGEAPPPAPAPPPGERAPVPVRVVEPEGTSMTSAAAVLGPLLGPLGMTLVVLVLTVFLLAYRADLRDRLIRLSSMSRMVVTTQALDDVSRRISRYLGAMVAVNALYAALLAAAFHLIGLPDPLVWALLAGTLRFVPYIGTWIGAAFPAIVSFAVFDDWGRTGLTVASIAVVEITAANVIEPLIYGRRTGLSPLAVVLCTLFWTWIWGIPGLLLAVPMTLVLAVLGRHVAGLDFLHVLLGDGPILEEGDRVYQRLVALDAEDAAGVVTERAAKTSLAEAYDEVLVPALVRAALDRERGALDEDGAATVREGARAVLEEVETVTASPDPGTRPIPCVPAGDAMDGLGAEMLAHVLRARGSSAEAISFRLLAWEAAEAVAERRPAVACLVGLPPLGASRARFLCRRIRQRSKEVQIVAVVLDASADRADLEERILEAGATRVATSLAEASEIAHTLSTTTAPVAATTPPARSTG